MFIPDKGDIVSFKPITDQGETSRLALVLSRHLFNAHTECVFVAPITHVLRGMKMEVVLPEETSTQGAVLIHQFTSLELSRHPLTFIEKVPAHVTDEAVALTTVILS